jgi:hypothetical protein
MKLTEYVDQYDHAPMELQEFADGAITINNCPSLSHAAEDYLAAKHAFEQALEQHNITIG